MAEDIKRKAQSVGADGQITKPEIDQLIVSVGKLLKRREVKTERA